MIRALFMPDAHSMKQTYIWTILASLIYAGSSFLMQMVTSKFVGIEQAGVLSLALTVGNQLMTIGFFNIRAFQISDVTEKYEFSDYCVFRVFTVGAMLLAGVIWVAQGSYTNEKTAAIALLVIFRGSEAVSDLLEGRYQQKGRYDVACRGVFAKDCVGLAAFLTVLFLTKNVILALTALAVVYVAAVLFIDSHIIGTFGGISFSSTWQRQKGLILEGLPLFINAFLNEYIINASKYALEKFYGSEMMGLFSPLYMMAFVVNMFAAFVLKPIISVLAEKYIKGDVKGFLTLILRQLLVIGIVTLGCIIGASFLGIPVLNLLYGVDLSEYKAALYLILISGGFTALYQLLQYGIIIMRHQYSTFVCCGITAIITYFITPFLTKKYAIMGAATSYSISIGVMSVLFLVFFVYYLIRDKKKQSEEKHE